MDNGDVLKKVLANVDESRRSFLRKLILGSAFAIPAVASFSIGALGDAQAQVCVSNLFVSNQAGPFCRSSFGKPGDFSDCVFAKQNLSGRNFACLVFEGANFSGANLKGTDLSFAVLTGANLAGADLTDANLTGANLADANLSDAIVDGAIFKDANLNGAKLPEGFGDDHSDH